ncbi:hypothetical protein NAF17_17345 [Mucilaginibacter sp. RB4R14]|uniref:hypothetical protein n=1 Tax=Mucilaginibacter aurantiaciroseus TaxID=2949308 RepID=UPI00209149E2|nr:hypothetical protein [Mucilaginibacter aurantiaciroseus]MCO5937316.1 hypothetical protein [Mucilaginibacter aurantiaciroseus]
MNDTHGYQPSVEWPASNCNTIKDAGAKYKPQPVPLCHWFEVSLPTYTLPTS